MIAVKTLFAIHEGKVRGRTRGRGRESKEIPACSRLHWCVCVCISIYIYIKILLYLFAYSHILFVCAFTHKYIHTDRHNNRWSNIHTYIHACELDAYIHNYLCIYICNKYQETTAVYRWKTQTLQYPLIKDYNLNQIKDPTLI